MEAVAFGAFFNTVLPKLLQKIKDSKRDKIAINANIQEFRNEAEAVQSQLEDGYSRYEGIGTGRDKAKLMQIDHQLKVLCQDTHDCIHRFLRRGSMESRMEFAAKIQKFNESVHKLHDEAQKCITSLKEGASGKPSDRYVPPDKVVGRLECLAELQELVQLPQGTGRQEEPKVISIVGFGGVGKTLLTKQFYFSEDGEKFHHRAWVTAAGSYEEVVKKILMEIDSTGNHADDALDLQRLCHSLQDFLRGKE